MKNNDAIYAHIKKIIKKGDLLVNQSLKEHTTFKIGGIADFLVFPSSIEEIVNLFQYLKNYEIPYKIIGNGSNLLINDAGFRGVIIKFSKRFSSIKVEDDIIDVECGTLLPTVSKTATLKGLSGLEFAFMIPGSVGGGIFMNCGCYGQNMADCLIETFYLDNKLNLINLKGVENKFGYRSSFFKESKENLIILSSKLKLKSEDPKKIKAKIDEISKKRQNSQPQGPSAGSIFKKPNFEFSAGELIEKAGLKGYTIGGAQISNKHAGFIINIGGATFKDVMSLITLAKEKVYKDFNIKLEEEVEIIK